MNKQKHTPSTNLQKSSVIFMQLGLILALFVVYIIMEHETYYKIKPIAMTTSIEEDDPKVIGEYILERKKTPRKKITKAEKPKKVVQVQKLFAEFKTVVNETKLKLDDAMPDITEDIPKIAPSITENDITEEDPIEKTSEPLPFIAVEIAPLFPGCEGGTKDQKRMCFNEKMKKHVNRKFNTDLAQTLGLSSGVKRINVQFVIDENGDITDIKVRAPHNRLKKETLRVVKLLPKMIPARQQLHNVKVRYNLPIAFMVEEE